MLPRSPSSPGPGAKDRARRPRPRASPLQSAQLERCGADWRARRGLTCGRPPLAARAERERAPGSGYDAGAGSSTTSAAEAQAWRRAAVGSPGASDRARRRDHGGRAARPARTIAAVIDGERWLAGTLQAGRSAAVHRSVVPHSSDYKRDRHHDAVAFEREYLRRHLPDPPCAAHAFMTACSMATVTTVLSGVREEGGLTGGLVVGHGVYHETKELLSAPAAVPWPRSTRRATWPSARLSTSTRRAPCSCDWVGSERDAGAGPRPRDPAPRCDGARRLAGGGQQWRLAASSTAGACAAAPREVCASSSSESLTKYAQLGLDRTTAGIITAAGDGVERLSEHRERLGTNVLDHSVHTLPWPDRQALSRRLGPDRAQCHPTWPSAFTARAAPRCACRTPRCATTTPTGARSRSVGGYLTIDLCPASAAGAEERFVRRAIAQAEAAASAARSPAPSFGLDVTRVYAPAGRAERRARLLRVAAGTEDRLAVEAVAAALVAAARESWAGGRSTAGLANARRPRGPPPEQSATSGAGPGSGPVPTLYSWTP